ncbi:putative small secreted protein [Methylohalomonas lacus]|uniref:Small secreted protein n=1 Tax=Methylohalomonas lacus TaxID=398773 RepID=A0AAE3HHN8_9GAMM|nr:entericidin A/B family lipoprotein [Methylohalomonas lacus]MCS3902075.1 putative small secreted protein [Methylohalomonas lacus]
MKTLTMLLLLGGFTLGLAGCNTMEGLGQDIERGGEELEEEANEAQH